jgi:hypothetical protein
VSRCSEGTCCSRCGCFVGLSRTCRWRVGLVISPCIASFQSRSPPSHSPRSAPRLPLRLTAGGGQADGALRISQLAPHLPPRSPALLQGRPNLQRCFLLSSVLPHRDRLLPFFLWVSTVGSGDGSGRGTGKLLPYASSLEYYYNTWPLPSSI